MKNDPIIHPLDGSEFEPLITLKESHELSRRQLWVDAMLKMGPIEADFALAEYDKRFPESVPQMFMTRSMAQK